MSQFVDLTQKEIGEFEQILEKVKKIADFCQRAIMCRTVDFQEWMAIGVLIDEVDSIQVESDILIRATGISFEGGDK